MFVLAFFAFILGCNTCKPVVDLDICENATGLTRVDCYDYGVKNANCVSICDSAKDAYWKDVCYKEVGIREQSVKICGKIMNQTVLEECLKNA